jgi:hypothetical protein
VTGTHGIAETAHAGTSLVDAAFLAAYLDVDRGWVYEHADELGVFKLGAGPRPRLRFDLDTVRDRLAACQAGRGSIEAETARLSGSRERRRRPLGTNVELLPIRGRFEAGKAA